MLCCHGFFINKSLFTIVSVIKKLGVVKFNAIYAFYRVINTSKLIKILSVATY